MAFKLKSVLFDERPLNLAVGRRRKGANHFTVIVGKNGVGKSRMLRAITQSFKAFDYDGVLPRERKRVSGAERPPSEFRLIYNVDGSTVELITHDQHVTPGGYYGPFSEIPRPSAVIATSVSPFDKFPVDKNTPVLGHRLPPWTLSLYRYLGSKNQVGQYSITTLLSRVLDSLVMASERSPRDVLRLSDVFEFLKYQPRIRAEYELQISKSLLSPLLNYSNDKDAEFLDELLRGGRGVRYYDIHRLIEQEPDLVPRIKEAVYRLSSYPQARGKYFTFDIDFHRGAFLEGSLQIYEDISLLRRLKVARLNDFRLFKDNWLSISVSDASSGEQSVVLTLLGIASEISDNSLICIDEPEISLHPEWQEKFIELLTATFSNYSGCHFLLATHSPQILSRIEGADASVLTMDDGVLHSAVEFSGKSSDYQLVEAFHAPGLRNEFLARIGLAVLTRLSTTGQVDAAYQGHYKMLLRARPLLEDDDPVAKLIDGIVSAEKGVDA